MLHQSLPTVQDNSQHSAYMRAWVAYNNHMGFGDCPIFEPPQSWIEDELAADRYFEVAEAQDSAAAFAYQPW